VARSEEEPLLAVAIIGACFKTASKIEFKRALHSLRPDGEPDQLLAIEEIRGALNPSFCGRIPDKLFAAKYLSGATIDPEVPVPIDEDFARHHQLAYTLRHVFPRRSGLADSQMGISKLKSKERPVARGHTPARLPIDLLENGFKNRVDRHRVAISLTNGFHLRH
jgi:hypothetical protein